MQYSRIAEAKGFIFDLDGVVWQRNRVIPGASETIDKLRDQGKRVMFVSNNSSETRQWFAAKLSRMGIDVEPGEVIVMANDASTQIMIDSRAVIPIYELEKKYKGLEIKDFVPQALQFYSANKKLQSMPFATSNALLYYNKNMFKAAGLDPGKPPETYKEFKEAAKVLTKPDASGKKCTALRGRSVPGCLKMK